MPLRPIGKLVGLSDSEIADSRDGQGHSKRLTAALEFARQIAEQRGAISEDALTRVRQAGFNDGEIAEIIANVALNVFTNYFNKAADVDIDFPKVFLLQSA